MQLINQAPVRHPPPPQRSAVALQRAAAPAPLQLEDPPLQRLVAHPRVPSPSRRSPGPPGAPAARGRGLQRVQAQPRRPRAHAASHRRLVTTRHRRQTAWRLQRPPAPWPQGRSVHHRCRSRRGRCRAASRTALQTGAGQGQRQWAAAAAAGARHLRAQAGGRCRGRRSQSPAAANRPGRCCGGAQAQEACCAACFGRRCRRLREGWGRVAVCSAAQWYIKQDTTTRPRPRTSLRLPCMHACTRCRLPRANAGAAGRTSCPVPAPSPPRDGRRQRARQSLLPSSRPHHADPASRSRQRQSCRRA